MCNLLSQSDTNGKNIKYYDYEKDYNINAFHYDMDNCRGTMW